MKTKDQFYNSLTDLEKGIYDFFLIEDPLLSNVESVLEIGSGWGLFTRMCMEYPRITVDTIDKIPEPRDFKQNTEGFEDRITRHIGDSKDILPQFADHSFDLVYVDGDHSYEGFKNDFIEALRIVKHGGRILVDDVCHKNNFVQEKDYGITKALSELILEKKLNVQIIPVGHGLAII